MKGRVLHMFSKIHVGNLVTLCPLRHTTFVDDIAIFGESLDLLGYCCVSI